LEFLLLQVRSSELGEGSFPCAMAKWWGVRPDFSVHVGFVSGLAPKILKTCEKLNIPCFESWVPAFVPFFNLRRYFEPH